MKKFLSAFLFVLAFATVGLAQTNCVRLQEIDGNPNVPCVKTIKVTNGTLSCTGNVCTLTISGGGGGSPGGSNGQLQWNDGGAFGGITGATTNGTVVTLTSALATTAFSPSANDAATLGSGTVSWSDLFLASGAVVNYANGNVVLTHSSGILTMGTGELRITTVGTNAASVPTIGSTNTFTNKTITASSNVLGGVTMTLGSDADGDTYYRASNVLTRLAIGTAGQCFKVNAGATAPEWGACGGGSPGGSDTQLQYNNASSFGGISGVTSDGTNVTAGSGNLRATSPRITTSVFDTNGNTLLGITATGSATEYITIANNTATNAVSLTASSPTQGASAIAGTPLSITASPAIAGNTNAGAAAGGTITYTSGAAARLTSGNANGGNHLFVFGAGIGTGTSGLMQLGGTTSSFPALRQNGANLNIVQADGTAGSSGTSILFTAGRIEGGSLYVTGKSIMDPNGRVAVISTGSFGSSSSGSDPTTTFDVTLRRAAAANWAFGATDAASPVAQTLSVQNVVAGTSNTAGANWTHNGSRGTGTGAGGDIIFQTAPAGGSGTSQNALAAAFTVKGDGAVQLKSVTFTNLPTVANGYLIYCSDCTLASPCASGGSGALAKGINGAWVCN